MILSKMVGFVGTSASFQLEARSVRSGRDHQFRWTRWSRNVGAFLYAFLYASKWLSWVKTYVIYIYIYKIYLFGGWHMEKLDGTMVGDFKFLVGHINFISLVAEHTFLNVNTDICIIGSLSLSLSQCVYIYILCIYIYICIYIMHIYIYVYILYIYTHAIKCQYCWMVSPISWLQVKLHKYLPIYIV